MVRRKIEQKIRFHTTILTFFELNYLRLLTLCEVTLNNLQCEKFHIHKNSLSINRFLYLVYKYARDLEISTTLEHDEPPKWNETSQSPFLVMDRLSPKCQSQQI